MTYAFRLGNDIYRVDFEERERLSVVSINGEAKEMECLRVDGNVYSLLIGNRSVTVGILRKGKKIQVFHEGDLYEVEAVSGRDVSAADGAGSLAIVTPMHSRVVKILKEKGEEVKAGESVVIVEAMKMESELRTSASGFIKEIKVAEGDTVEKDTVLVTLSTGE